MIRNFLFQLLNFVLFSPILISQTSALTHSPEVWALQDLRKDACSPSSKGGYGIAVNNTGHVQSNAGVFASLHSTRNNDLPSSLAGNSSNGGEFPFYPYSDLGTEYESCVVQRHQGMVNRHSMFPSCLLESSKELQKNLSFLVQASLENRFNGGGFAVQTQSILFDVLQGFHGLNLAGRKGKLNGSVSREWC